MSAVTSRLADVEKNMERSFSATVSIIEKIETLLRQLRRSGFPAVMHDTYALVDSLHGGVAPMLENDRERLDPGQGLSFTWERRGDAGVVLVGKDWARPASEAEQALIVAYTKSRINESRLMARCAELAGARK